MGFVRLVELWEALFWLRMVDVSWFTVVFVWYVWFVWLLREFVTCMGRVCVLLRSCGLVLVGYG